MGRGRKDLSAMPGYGFIRSHKLFKKIESRELHERPKALMSWIGTVLTGRQPLESPEEGGRAGESKHVKKWRELSPSGR